MRIKINKQFIILSILITILLVSFASAQSSSNWWYLSKDSSAGSSGALAGDGFGSNIANIFGVVINSVAQLAMLPVTLPLDNGDTSALAMILTFIIMFSIIHPATAFIHLFKNGQNKGPRKAFSIAFSLLVVFFSPAANYVFTFIRDWVSWLIQWALLFLFVVILWWIWNQTRKGFASVNKIGAEAGTIEGANKRANQDSRKIKYEAKNEEHALRREKETIEELEHLTHQERQQVHTQLNHWQNIKHKLARMGDVSTDSGKKLRAQLLDEVSSLLRHEHKTEEVNDMLYKLSMRNKHDAEKLKKFLAISEDKYNDLMKQLTGETGRGTNISPTVHTRMDVNAAKKHIHEARHNAAMLYNLSKRLENFAWKEEKYQSQVANDTMNFIGALRNADGPAAGSLCDKIIKELHREEQLLNELKYTEGRLMKMDHNIFREIIDSEHING